MERLENHQMEDDVKYIALGQLCDDTRGITYGIVKVGNFIPDGVPVIRGGDIREGRIVFNNEKRVTIEVSQQFKRTILQGGELVINLISEPGHTAIVPDEFIGANVSRDVGVIPLNDSVDHRYVDYYLKSPMAIQWLTSRLQGSVTQKINLGTLRELPIPIVNLEKQQAISYILGTLDDKIELNRRMNETLEAMARAIFKSWFVDFDPVRAKMSGEPPESICRRLGLTAELLDIFPDRLQDSKLGEIPSEWEVSTLKQLANKIGSGATPRGGREVYLDEGIALIRSQNVYDSEFDWDGLVRISDEAANQLRGVVVQSEDVLLNITGASILRTCVVDSEVLPARVNQHVTIIRAKPGIPSRFIHLFLLQKSTKDYLMGLNAGASREAVTKGHIESVPIIKPPSPVLAQFQGIIGPIYSEAEQLCSQTRSLAELRDTLLPKLLSGELPVPIQGEA